MSDTDPLLTVAEGAAQLRYTPKGGRGLCQRGALPGAFQVIPGGPRRIPQSGVDSLRSGARVVRRRKVEANGGEVAAWLFVGSVALGIVQASMSKGQPGMPGMVAVIVLWPCIWVASLTMIVVMWWRARRPQRSQSAHQARRGVLRHQPVH